MTKSNSALATFPRPTSNPRSLQRIKPQRIETKGKKEEPKQKFKNIHEVLPRFELGLPE